MKLGVAYSMLNDNGEMELSRAERRKLKARRNRKRFLKIAKSVLAIECGVLLIEGLYRFGTVIRGYNSFGGESLLVVAGVAYFLYWGYQKAKYGRG